jgi:hypothetical protein
VLLQLNRHLLAQMLKMMETMMMSINLMEI